MSADTTASGSSPPRATFIGRVFAWMIAHRGLSAAAAALLTVVLGAYASRVRPDYAVEQFFPVGDPSYAVFDRFKRAFPFEDTQAGVVVEAPDLFTRAGLERLARLEDDLAQIPTVISVEGPMSAKDIVKIEDGVKLEKLFPSANLSDEELARRKRTVTTDPLFAWALAKPDGSAVTVRLVVDKDVASAPAGRALFWSQANAVLARHNGHGLRAVLTGLPTIRAQHAQMIADDTARLLPATIVVVLLLLALTFRSVTATLAGLLTILVSLVWSYGAIGVLGYPIGVMMNVLPVMVIIISISDTVHIVNDFLEHRRSGQSATAATAETMAHSAIPCLLTEVVIACGFLSLVAMRMPALVQLGVAAAFAMLLTWLANVSVLPLLLSLERRRPRPSAAPGLVRTPVLLRLFGKMVGWIEVQVTTRPRRVLLVSLAIAAAATALTARAGRLAYMFGDLRPDTPIARDIRFAEERHGGLLPVAIYLEVDGRGAEDALQPEFIAFMDRATQLLRGLPDVTQASSMADYLRKVHTALTGTPGLPTSRSLAVQEALLIDDARLLRDVMSFDRKHLAALAWIKDVGSNRTAKIFAELDAWLAKEQAIFDARPGGPRARVYVTGQVRMFDVANHGLTDGLVASFGGSLLLSFLMMTLVLRSWKLGVLGLIPNVAPILLVTALMGISGIHLNATNVVLFSLTLVIAEDDTIQFLARARGHFRAALAQAALDPGVDPHRTAAVSCLRDVGLPMFVTSTSVSLGFFLLLGSNYLAIAHLGLLIGTTLFSAVFADLFLTPLLLIKMRPFAAEARRHAGRDGAPPAVAVER